MPIHVLKAETIELSDRPDVRYTLPGFHVLGGGAALDYVNQPHPGCLLTTMAPILVRDIPYGWQAAGKAHQVSGPTSISMWSYLLSDPGDEFEVVAFVSPESARSLAPQATAEVGPGFTLTGGGAVSLGREHLLTMSRPVTNSNTNRRWRVASKAHFIPELASIQAIAIGIKDRSGRPIAGRTTPGTSGRGGGYLTAVSADLPDGFVLTGGGAVDLWEGLGRLLVASKPTDFNPRSWTAVSKDHSEPALGTLFAFARGIRLPPPR